MRRTITQAWAWFWSAGTATKAWTLGGITLAVAAGSLAATSTLVEATQSAAAATPPAASAGSTPASAGSPPSSTGMSMSPGATSSTGAASTGAASMGAASMGAASSPTTMPGMASDTSGICPNVTGATAMSHGMVMAPVPSGPPTPAQAAAAAQLVAQTTADIQKYANLSVAEAAGYEPITSQRGQMTHYADWTRVGPDNVLNPDAPPSLMYANTVSGPVLMGAMFFGPGPCQPGPDIGGSLTDWHAHANLCLDAQHQVVGTTDATGACGTGVHNTQTLFMLHVWTAPQLAQQYQFQADLPQGALRPIITTGQP